MAAAAGVLAGAGGAVARGPRARRRPRSGWRGRWRSLTGSQARIDKLSAGENTLREQNAQLVRVNEELRSWSAAQAARLAEANESLAVLQRMVFGRKSEKDRPGPRGAGDGDDCPAGDDGGRPAGREEREAGPGGAGGAAGLLALAEGRGDIGTSRAAGTAAGLRGEPFTLLGDAPVRGAAQLASHNHGAGELPAPL